MPSKTNIVLRVLHKFSVILMLRTSKISQCGIWFPNLVAWSYLVVKWSLLRFTFIQEALIFAQKAAAPAAIWSPRSHLVAHQVAGASGRQSGVVVDAFSFSNLSAGLNALHADIWHVLSFTYVPSRKYDNILCPLHGSSKMCPESGWRSKLYYTHHLAKVFLYSLYLLTKKYLAALLCRRPTFLGKLDKLLSAVGAKTWMNTNFGYHSGISYYSQW